MSVRSAEHLESIVRIVVAWELCWYRYEVDTRRSSRVFAQAVAQGTELDELAPRGARRQRARRSTSGSAARSRHLQRRLPRRLRSAALRAGNIPGEMIYCVVPKAAGRRALSEARRALQGRRERHGDRRPPRVRPARPQRPQQRRQRAGAERRVVRDRRRARVPATCCRSRSRLSRRSPAPLRAHRRRDEADRARRRRRPRQPRSRGRRRRDLLARRRGARRARAAARDARPTTSPSTARCCWLARARELGADEVEVVGDSELIAKQVQGLYKVKHEACARCTARRWRRCAGFERWSIRTVPRAQNARRRRARQRGAGPAAASSRALAPRPARRRGRLAQRLRGFGDREHLRVGEVLEQRVGDPVEHASGAPADHVDVRAVVDELVGAPADLLCVRAFANSGGFSQSVPWKS